MSWKDRAACRGYPTAWWFAGKARFRDGQPVGEDNGPVALAKAKAICAKCPVAGHCYDEWRRARDIEGRVLLGLWGNMDAPVTRDNSTDPGLPIDEHGTYAGFRAHLKRGHSQALGQICQPCLDARNDYKRAWRANRKLILQPPVGRPVDGDRTQVA